ncbi:unnamed protein product [Brugia pahangi]|uniref:Tom37 domain-containing protein n=1 Tax=Brugia pahangi TaxID=6280 RepID=A0A0N4T3B3_BRUPA|nr:unnamed protein product [Brugia pahangi]
MLEYCDLLYLPILTTDKLWIVITAICLLDTIEPADGQFPFMKSKKRRYKLIPFYDGDIKISDPSKPALIQDLSLLSYVLNNTADTVFGSKDIARDSLTFFADLDQIMMLACFCLKGKQWLFLFLICSSIFHMAACVCIGCCACYVFKNDIRNTLKFAKRQAKSPDQTPAANDVIGGESPAEPSPRASVNADAQPKAIDASAIPS